MPAADTDNKRDASPPAGGRWLAGLHIAAAILLAIGLTVLLNLLALRLNVTREKAFAVTRPVSARTREILSHARGQLRVVCFLDQKHPAFLPTGRLLRGFGAVVSQGGGATIEISYVDPRRDLVRATALTAAGVAPNAVLFEAQGRRIVVPASELIATNQGARSVFHGETVCAAAIARLARSEQAVVYWLMGHGEGDPSDYDGLTGFTTIAREIRHEGYDLRLLDLWRTKCVPADAEALVVVGPQRTLSSEELAWVEAFMTRGGRLLYLVHSAHASGLEDTLERWGVRITPWTAVSRETISGHDTLILRYGDHPITRSLTNSGTVFIGSRCILPSAAADAAGADRARFTALALTSSEGWGARASDGMPRLFDPRVDLPGPVAVAAAVERGAGAGSDILLQSMRLVVAGERDFVANGTLAARSSANRDLFINALNWLTGIETGTGISGGGDAALWTGLDRSGWMLFTVLAAGGIPVAVLLIGGMLVLVRRVTV
ncbi:MAG: Gldg family protein [bacterium]